MEGGAEYFRVKQHVWWGVIGSRWTSNTVYARSFRAEVVPWLQTTIITTSVAYLTLSVWRRRPEVAQFIRCTPVMKAHISVTHHLAELGRGENGGRSFITGTSVEPVQ